MGIRLWVWRALPLSLAQNYRLILDSMEHLFLNLALHAGMEFLVATPAVTTGPAGQYL
jgi:hypothetical protein